MAVRHQGAAPPVVRPARPSRWSADDAPRSSRPASRSRSATSQALEDLDLDVPEGAFFVLLGPSGAGKTTTLRVIAGLEKPDYGHRPPERDRRDGGHAGRARPGDGVPVLRAVPEADGGGQHRLAAAGAQAAQGRRSTRRSSAWPSCCTSSSCCERKPAQMSGGEMQRVALGRALVREPRAFLMDEPLTNLDLKLRVEMRTELTRIHRSLGRTFLYVTNDQVEAMSMADQVAVLREGTVQQVGAPTEIYDRPANRWVATFVGSPRMNLLPCTANGRLEGNGWSAAEPRLRGRRRPPGAARRARGGPVAGRARRVGGARRHGLRRRAAGRPHARRHRDRRPADRGQGAADGVAADRRAASARRSTSTASTCSTPTAEAAIATAMIDATAHAGAQAGADPRARPARGRRVARGPRLASTPSRRSPSTATSSCSPRRGCWSACAAAPARCPTRRPPIETGWNARVREAAPREGRDRRSRRASWSRTGRRSSSTRPSTGLALARALELRPPTELTLVTNSPAIALGLTADIDPRDRAAGRARSAHARAHRPLDGRLPGSSSTSPSAFISAAGITLEHGLTTSRSAARRHAERGRRVRAERTVGLLDSTKFERSSLHDDAQRRSRWT